ncbi:FHA domain-containing protein [Candidatus Ichthyocystis sparus]|uniref:FHA domain-containing protein n=2 Tax=Candidatus Ichthyocystis sparus TaxID=1561004 RepID=UPI000B8A24EE|nr:FHA domain-containing protein [Candidatus Ichthyocystis sparus]
MAMIILEKNGVAVRSILVNKDCIRVGRRHGNDCILSDPSVSGYHAEIHSTFSGHYIKDLSSTNGTFINDKLVSFTRIKPDDVIRLGNSVIRLEFPNTPTKSSYVEPEPSVHNLNSNISGSDWLESLSLSLDSSDKSGVVDPAAYESDVAKDISASVPDVSASISDVDASVSDVSAYTSEAVEVAHKEDILELRESDEWIGAPENWATLIVKPSNKNFPERRLSLNKPYVKVGASNKCVFTVTYDVSGYWLECLKGPELPLLNGAKCNVGELYRLFDGDYLTLNSANIFFYWPR